MRRPLWLRALLGIWGLWFTAALLEAPGIHGCAVHSAGGAHGHGGSELAAPAPTHTTSLADHHGSASHAPKNDKASDCTCIGFCCSASPAIADGPSIRPAQIATIANTSRFVPVEQAGALSRPYARPFANGPPGYRSDVTR